MDSLTVEEQKVILFDQLPDHTEQYTRLSQHSLTHPLDGPHQLASRSAHWTQNQEAKVSLACHGTCTKQKEQVAGEMSEIKWSKSKPLAIVFAISLSPLFALY